MLLTQGHYIIRVLQTDEMNQMTRGIQVRFLLGEPSHAQGSRPVSNAGPPGRLGRVISDRELTCESQSLTVTDPGMSDTRTDIHQSASRREQQTRDRDTEC